MNSPLPIKNPSEPTPIKQAQLREKKDRLVDAYISGLIDKETLQAKETNLLVQENELSQISRNTRSQEEIQVHIAQVLEHLTTLVSTYVLANSSEKRQFLEILFSNISLSGKTPLFTTKKWLQEVTNLQAVPYGGGYCIQFEPETKRLHDECIQKHGRKPTLEEFMAFEEPYCTQIEPQIIWSGKGGGQIVLTLLKKYPCLAIITDMADEYFAGFRQYIQEQTRH